MNERTEGEEQLSGGWMRGEERRGEEKRRRRKAYRGRMRAGYTKLLPHN